MKVNIPFGASFSEKFIANFWANHQLLADLLGVNPDLGKKGRSKFHEHILVYSNYKMKDPCYSEGNYLFDKEDEKIIEKILPDEKVNIYRNKYEDILNQKKEIEEIMKTDCNTIQKEKESIFNKCEYNNMELKNKKIDNLQLVMKSQKLRDKINNMKQIIKQYREKINKEDKKLNEEKRMNNYYKKLKEIQKSSLE